jgi:hypothetical protein
MPAFLATPDIVIIDPSIGQKSATTDIIYEKEEYQELWEKLPGAAWTFINVHKLTGLGDEADRSNKRAPYTISLRPGEAYEAGIFGADHGPTTTDPIKFAGLIVYGLLKKPTGIALITDERLEFGGTWCKVQIHTQIPTNMVSIGVSRKPPTLDANGIPRPDHPDGTVFPGLALAMDHIHQIGVLFPGNDYFLSVVVVDATGNWDVRQRQFTALRRSIQIKFPKITVLNDGDPFDDGEGDFLFRVFNPSIGGGIIEDFQTSTIDIDDWSETGRPYVMGFVHMGVPLVVSPETFEVSVSSFGTEHDGFLESDEYARNWGVVLPFPTGQFVENANGKFVMDCPIQSDDDFHYNVDVEWSVTYVP